MSRLRITEIFYSLQGESSTVGLPTVFVRLTGCPLRCNYCDTSYAFHGGEWMTVGVITRKVAAYSPRYVTVTGGEPLAQPACPELLTKLCNEGYHVSLETAGSLDISRIDPRVVRVVDMKTPGSGEMDQNLLTNLDRLTQMDQVKFVISDEEDYIWSKEQLATWDLANRCEVLFSPVEERQNATELAEWILRDRLQVRLQIQLHKYLWGDEPGR